MFRKLLLATAALTLLAGATAAFAQSSGQIRTNEEAAMRSDSTWEARRGNSTAQVRRPGFTATPTQTTDTYCRNNSNTYPPCDDDFKNKCSGTMSGPQGWGGQTCFTTSGGRAPE